MNQYATSKNPFVLVNQTGKNLDTILNGQFIVNTEVNPQPMLYLSNVSQVRDGNFFAGTLFNEWTSRDSNRLTLLYNDSALLSIPYLVHTLSNFYARLDGDQLINATLSPWPRTTANTIQNTIDYSSFTALIVLGTGLVMPLVTFAVELVYDREVTHLPIRNIKDNFKIRFYFYFSDEDQEPNQAERCRFHDLLGC